MYTYISMVTAPLWRMLLFSLFFQAFDLYFNQSRYQQKSVWVPFIFIILIILFWFPLQGNIEGGRTSLWIRAWLQEQLFILGCFLQGDAGKVLFVAILVLSTFCVGLKSAQIHSRVDQLWVQGTFNYSYNILFCCLCVWCVRKLKTWWWRHCGILCIK